MSGSTSATAGRGDDTRQRLLLTALQLYAQEGLHAISLRRISTTAGSKNSAAMHYHFHNKPGVVQALVELIARELAAIDAELRAGQPPPASLQEACRNTLLPLVQLSRVKPWGADAIRFMSRVASDNDQEIAAVINPVYEPFWRRLDQRLASLLPELPAEVRQLRLIFMSVNVLHGMAGVRSLAHTPLGDLSHLDHDVLLNHLVDYLIGGLQAPTHSHNPESQ